MPAPRRRTGPAARPFPSHTRGHIAARWPRAATKGRGRTCTFRCTRGRPPRRECGMDSSWPNSRCGIPRPTRKVPEPAAPWRRGRRTPYCDTPVYAPPLQNLDHGAGGGVRRIATRGASGLAVGGAGGRILWGRRAVRTAGTAPSGGLRCPHATNTPIPQGALRGREEELE